MDFIYVPTHTVRLEPHPTARNQATATSHLTEGSTIIAIPSLATVLLPPEKGHRCDNCFRLQSARRQLRKCTGCASYWYCDTLCAVRSSHLRSLLLTLSLGQTTQWKAHHKNMCKLYNQYVSSSGFQLLASHEKLDSLLLSHLLCQSTSTSTPDGDYSMSVFRTLLPGSTSGRDIPVLLGPSSTTDSMRHAYSRFGNNNFAIHSHLTTVGHGIFPLASRLFNHSCNPNAAAKFILSLSKPVTMEVVALRDISPGEEVSFSVSSI
jgi:hypothetical protein